MIEYIKYNYVKVLIILLVLSLIIFVLYCLKDKRNRHRLGFYINYLSYKLGLSKRISRSFIAGVHTKESNEPLVDLVKHPKIFHNDETLEHPVLLRKTVAMKLYKVADSLPEGVYLKIYSAFRSRIDLYKAWKSEEEILMKENPTMSRAELINLVNAKVSSPNVSMGGHDTGAAIDLALCDSDGNDFDFGTKIKEKHKKIHLTDEQKKNRRMLKCYMMSNNFVNIPSQWWHFSYGDKVWSAYKGKRNGAFYGAAEKEFENMGYIRVIKTEIKSVNIK